MSVYEITKLKYPINLIKAVTGKMIAVDDIPEDFDATLRYILLPYKLKNGYVTIIARYRDGRTLSDIGDEIGVSRERVRRIEAQVIKILQNPKHVKKVELGLIGEREAAIAKARSDAFQAGWKAAVKDINKVENRSDDWKDLSIDVLGFAPPINTRLKNARIYTINDICNTTAKDLYNIYGIGSTALRHITKIMNESELKLKKVEDV